MADRSDEQAVALEPVEGPLRLTADRRPNMPEPPPVRLVAVQDLHRPTAAGLEKNLDDFYAGVLPLVREAGEFPVYRAEKFAVVFDVVEPPITREGYQPIGLELYDLPAAEERLIGRKVEYEKVQYLVPGRDGLLLKDPAGNWVILTPYCEVM